MQDHIPPKPHAKDASWSPPPTNAAAAASIMLQPVSVDNCTVLHFWTNATGGHRHSFCCCLLSAPTSPRGADRAALERARGCQPHDGQMADPVGASDIHEGFARLTAR